MPSGGYHARPADATGTGPHWLISVAGEAIPGGSLSDRPLLPHRWGLSLHPPRPFINPVPEHVFQLHGRHEGLLHFQPEIVGRRLRCPADGSHGFPFAGLVSGSLRHRPSVRPHCPAAAPQNARGDPPGQPGGAGISGPQKTDLGEGEGKLLRPDGKKQGHRSEQPSYFAAAAAFWNSATNAGPILGTHSS